MFKLYVAIFLLLLSPALLSAQSAQTKKSVGKIIFATEPFSNGNVSKTKSFKSSDFIYGQLVTNGNYFYNFLTDDKGKMVDKDKIYPKWYLRYALSVYKNNKFIYAADQDACLFTNINWNIETLNFDILPSSQNASTTFVSRYWERTPKAATLHSIMRDLRQMYFPESGVYTIKVSIFNEAFDEMGKAKSWDDNQLFEGEFDFAFNINDLPDINANAIAISKKAEDLKLEASKMPYSWTDKSAASAAGFTVAQIKKAFIDLRDADAQIMKVYIEPTGSWVISYNKFGIPTEQYLDKKIYVFYKLNGDCRGADVYIRKRYLGGGKYGPANISTTENSFFEKYPCSKMK